MLTADDVVRLLDLQPHPIEGGFFRETYRSRAALPASMLPAHGADRSAGTAIDYLLTPRTVSELHRLPGDEVFHFYLGDPVRQLQLHPDGTTAEHTPGTDLTAGCSPGTSGWLACVTVHPAGPCVHRPQPACEIGGSPTAGGRRPDGSTPRRRSGHAVARC